MTTYSVVGPAHTGASVGLAAPGGTTGDLAPTGQGIGLLVNNGSASPITVSIAITPTYDGLVVGPTLTTGSGTGRNITVPNGQMWLIPLPDSVYGPGLVAVNYSAVATVTVGVIRIP